MAEAKYKIGDKVIMIDTNAVGIVTKVMPAGRGGRQLYTVTFPSGDSNVLEVDLRPDFNTTDPFERCKSGIFGSYSEYSKRNTTFKIKNSNNSTISSLKASKTLFRAYQFKPLLKFLNSPNRRLLVADEVGLGKTIEAGHVMLELKARNELRNVLIVCPKSLQEKWKAELYEKFGLPFKIIEHSKDLIADLSAKGGAVRAIVNYEKIRHRDRKEKQDKAPTTLIQYLIENPQSFSLVLCDEAHKMRNRETQTYRGAEVLMDNADGALFLTATPVMISEENLYNLLHLLDSTRYFNYDIFKNRLNENQPFVEAMTELSRQDSPFSFADIREKLLNAEVRTVLTTNDREVYNTRKTLGELYEKDPMFEEILALLSGEDTPKVRAHLQYLLASMNVMSTVFSRTRKKEVTTDMTQAVRHPQVCKVELYDEEREDFDAVIDNYTDDNSYTDDWGEEKLTFGGSLGLVQKKRQVASSVYGYLNTETDLDRGYDAYESCPDAKVEALVEIIKKVFADGTRKIVVFALFRKTLKYLQIRLKTFGYNSLIIHGQVENRAEVLQQFKDDAQIHILLSSEVGSEGLDMQFCDSMVNYDLPWNPMVVEQRIGRIDRFGQKSPVVNIFNILVADSIQEDIYMRLLDRIGIFKHTIGDLEAILDAEIIYEGRTRTILDVYSQMEKEFFTKKLSQAEMDRKLAEVDQAFENEHEHLAHLQEGLSNTLTNDAYFQDEINRLLHKNAYVTSEELKNYVKSVIRQYLTTCNLEEVDKDVLEFRVAASQPTTVSKFITMYSENTDESAINAIQFKRRIEDKLSFRLTFEQDAAYENATLNYLNIYHPFIQSCLNYFIQNDDNTQTSFSYALKADDVLHAGERYYMGLYQLTSTRKIQGVKKVSADLIPIVFNLTTEQVETDQTRVDQLFRRSQVEGLEHNASNKDTDAELINDMSYDFADIIRKERTERMQKEFRQNESDRMRNEQQASIYYTTRLEELERKRQETERDLMWLPDEESKTAKKRLSGYRLQINKLEKERDERLALINEDKHLEIKEDLVALNLITII
jgi:SNF2 family DNA or RNA helicase